jgi:hypothetical protein
LVLAPSVVVEAGLGKRRHRVPHEGRKAGRERLVVRGGSGVVDVHLAETLTRVSA